LQNEMGFLPSIKFCTPISVSLRVTELAAAKIMMALNRQARPGIRLVKEEVLATGLDIS
jgi:hypothetical protein